MFSIIILALIASTAFFISDSPNIYGYGCALFALIIYSCYPFLRTFPEKIPVFVYRFSLISAFLLGFLLIGQGGVPIELLLFEFWILVILSFQEKTKTIIGLLGVYVVLNTARHYSNLYFDIPYQINTDVHSYFSLLWIGLILVAVLFRVSVYMMQRKSVIKRLDITSKTLIRNMHAIENDTHLFEERYHELGEIASINSHDMRRPVARIQAVIQMYDDLMEHEMDPEKQSGIVLYEELESNMIKIQKETDSFQIIITDWLKQTESQLRKTRK